MATRRKVSRTTLRSGPWKGVFDTRDPFDASPDLLADLKNCYIPDAADGSGVYARPGFLLGNAASPITTSVDPVAGQGVHKHTRLDGSTINFVVAGGKLFRVVGDVYTDVSPVGISIDTNPFTPVYFASLVGTLVVNDGVSRPWVGANLTSTPITGTYIDYDGAGVAWTAFGQPVVKDGAAIMILNAVGGVSRRADISWSAPGDPTTGWQQPDFDYNWTLSTNDAGSLFALCATNLALFYFREESIGSASGEVGPDFASTATQDSVSFNVGCRTPRSVQTFGDAIFFCDALGRPHRLRQGNPPEPIWHQMRAKVEAARTDAVSIIDLVLVSALDRSLNLYLVAPWSPTPSTAARPTELYVFDARTATYQGRWTINDVGLGSGGIDLHAMGTLADANGLDVVTVMGTLTDVGTVGGYVWTLMGPHDAHSGRWEDNTIPPDRIAATNPLGSSEDVVYNVDRVTVITGNNSPCTVRVTTPTALNALQATPDVNGSSLDGTYRLVAGCELQGRGPSVSVSPTEAITEQWILHRIALTAIPSTAHPEDA